MLPAGKQSLTDEYFSYVEKYTHIYGPDTIVLLQNGSFYEMYAIDNEQEKIFAEIKAVCELLDIFLSRKNKGIKENGRGNPLMAGFPTWSCDKHIQKLLDHGHTVVLFEQRLIQKDNVASSSSGVAAFERVLSQVLSPSLQSEYHKSVDAQFCVCFYLSVGSEYLTRTEFWNVSTSILSVLNGNVFLYDNTHSRTERCDSIYFDMVRILRTHEAGEIIIVLDGGRFSRCDFFWRKQLGYYGTIHIVDVSSKGDLAKIFGDEINGDDLKKCRYQTEFFNRVYQHVNVFSSISRIEVLNLENYQSARLSLMFLLQFVSNHKWFLLDRLQLPVWFEYLQDKKPRFCRIENNSLEQLGILAYPQPGQVGRMTARSCSEQPRCVFDVINETITAPGHRMVKDSICRPLVEVEDIRERQRMVRALKNNPIYLEATREHFRRAADIERLHRRLQLGTMWFTDFSLLDVTYDTLRTVMSLWIDVLSLKHGEGMQKPAVAGRSDGGGSCRDQETLASAAQVLEALDGARKMMREHLHLSNCAGTARNQVVEAEVFNTDLYEELGKLLLRKDSALSAMDRERRRLEDRLTLCFSKDVPSGHKVQRRKRTKADTVAEIVKTKDKASEAGEEQQTEGPDSSSFVKIEYTEKDKHYLTMSNTKLRLMQEAMSKETDLQEVYKIRTSTSTCKITSVALDRLNEELVVIREEIDRFSKRELASFVKKFNLAYGEMYIRFNFYLAYIDFLQSGATVSQRYAYTTPRLEDVGSSSTVGSFISAKKLRHPLVERILQSTMYVANDVAVGRDTSGYLIFGTNSCGKSVFMKSVGVAVVMAQMGYDVPCEDMILSPFHNIITRMTGNDDPLRGHSSFAVEMIELNLILLRSSPFSLVLGDEICHGTEQVSGLSLVAASLMDLCARRVPFVFASHLHQLSQMEEITGIENLAIKHLTVKHCKESGTLIYERKLKEGSGNATYGLEVARHIIDDADFICRAERIQQSLLERPQGIVPPKVSRYNSKLYIDRCQVCGKKAVETHHIIEQKEANQDKMVEAETAGGAPIKVHHLSNLVALCAKCHHSIHKAKGKRLRIYGYNDTALGPKLNFSWT